MILSLILLFTSLTHADNFSCSNKVINVTETLQKLQATLQKAEHSPNWAQADSIKKFFTDNSLEWSPDYDVLLGQVQKLNEAHQGFLFPRAVATAVLQKVSADKAEDYLDHLSSLSTTEKIAFAGAVQTAWSNLAKILVTDHQSEMAKIISKSISTSGDNRELLVQEAMNTRKILEELPIEAQALFISSIIQSGETLAQQAQLQLRSLAKHPEAQSRITDRIRKTAVDATDWFKSPDKFKSKEEIKKRNQKLAQNQSVISDTQFEQMLKRTKSGRKWALFYFSTALVLTSAPLLISQSDYSQLITWIVGITSFSWATYKTVKTLLDKNGVDVVLAAGIFDNLTVTQLKRIKTYAAEIKLKAPEKESVAAQVDARIKELEALATSAVASPI